MLRKKRHIETMFDSKHRLNNEDNVDRWQDPYSTHDGHQDEEDYTIPINDHNYNYTPQSSKYQSDEEDYTIPLDNNDYNRSAQNFGNERRENNESSEQQDKIVTDDPMIQPLPDQKRRTDTMIVGWLVCIEGKNRGCDYRIQSGMNTIGSGESNSVALAGETSVSHETQAVVVYEPKANTFYAVPGKTRGLSYVNGQVVLGQTELKKNDILELGSCKLMLIPCCDEKFQWNMPCEM